MLDPIAIIGGGPSGAMAAAGLARQGREVRLYDEHLAWEKPCGGGVTDKALARYPFLRNALVSRNWVTECDLISPAGRQARLELNRPIAIFSRRVLNQLLLDRARAAGVELVRARVSDLKPKDEGWQLTLSDGAEAAAPAVVISAGARGAFPACPSPLAARDWMATAGYYLPLERLAWPAQRMVIRFLPGLDGYIWSFPRSDYASVGICGRIGEPPAAELRRRLEAWLDQQGIVWRGATFYGHLLPAPDARRLLAACYAASGPAPWFRTGDAAGLVDPITGEGLYYALRSAEMLAEAWPAANAAAAYTAALQAEILPELAAAGRIADRFYRGRFCGAGVLERMTQFTARSAAFRQLMCELFSGAQGYLGLRARLYRNLLPTLAQLALPRS